MPESKPKATMPTKSLLTAKKWILLAFIGVVILVVVVLTVRWAIAVHQESQRFDRLHTMYTSFENYVRHDFDSSLTDLHETDYCSHPSQSEVAIPPSNGRGPLYCYMRLEATTTTQPDIAKNSTLQIASEAKKLIQQTDSLYRTAQNNDFRHYFGTNGSIQYIDTYFLLDQMRCDVSINTPFTAGNVNDANYRVKSLHFVLDCSQQASKALFQVTD